MKRMLIFVEQFKKRYFTKESLFSELKVILRKESLLYFRRIVELKPLFYETKAYFRRIVELKPLFYERKAYFCIIENPYFTKRKLIFVE